MMKNDDERGGGGKKCPKFDDVICERPLMKNERQAVFQYLLSHKTHEKQ